MKQALYTCDHCGRPVGLHDARCPGCGKFFDAVRCPRCHHQGPPAAFAAGCPSCHYLAPTPAKDAHPSTRRSLFAPVMSVLVFLLLLAVGLSWFLRLG